MGQATSELKQVRLDKWLWAARIYKTRSIARAMIDGGKVQYNGQRSKPRKYVTIGDKVKLRQGYEEKSVTIEKISDISRVAPEAQLLYQEKALSIELRELHAQMRKLNAFDSPSPIKRPDKKQRRDIMRFKNINTSE